MRQNLWRAMLKSFSQHMMPATLGFFALVPFAPAGPPEDNFRIAALTPPWLDTKPLPSYWPRARMWQGIPGIERAPGGRLWATWYTGLLGEGKGQNYCLLVTSGDDGKTWSKPVAVYDPSRQLIGGDSNDPALWVDPNGKMWWIVNRLMKVPDQPSRTVWGFYTEEPDAAFPEWKGPVFLGYGNELNKPTVLKDGTWMFTVDWFYRTPSENPLLTKEAKLYRFTGYDTPTEYVGGVFIPDSPFAEHMFIERKDGSFWMLARTTYGIAQIESRDGGRTWSEATPFTQEFGVNTRFFLRPLKSGNILLVANDHPKNRCNMTAFLSKDEGKTWPHKLVLDERGAVSYPDGTQGDDGFIYITYDRGRYYKDQQEILFAKITEA
ncbi:exo-alpha-sialidase, partial [bacterium]|nr:exo-alpha-sialidase [bacterium]